MIDQVLLDILICPVCKSRVRQQDESICCTGCGRVYPIRDGIPVMLIDESEVVAPEEFDRVMAKADRGHSADDR